MMFIAALSLFAAVAVAVTAVRSSTAAPAVTALDDQPRRAPLPGARDRFSVAAPTLGRAPVPSWG